MKQVDYNKICSSLSYHIDRKRIFNAKGYVAYDLRGLENAPANFRVDIKDYYLFFNLIENTKEVILSGCEHHIFYSTFNNTDPNPSLEIPKEIMGYTLTQIGEHAFEDKFKYSIKNIIIPDSVYLIGSWAFKNCQAVEFVNIPNSVKRIEKGAFYHCDSLSKVYIPESVSYIGYGAFSACTNLISIKVDQENDFFDSRNDCNAIIHTASNKMIALCRYTIFPDSVTDIDYSVSMGSSMQEMKNLKECIIMSGETYIGDKAFSDCDNLETVILPNTIKEIGDFAFHNCTKLKEIGFPESLEKIGRGAFKGCAHLVSVKIPKSVITIESEAFSYCSNLVSIAVDKKNEVYYSENKCNAIVAAKTRELMHGCSCTKISATVKGIGKYAFVGCAFRSIIIPDTVELIDHNAFVDCPNLVDVFLISFNTRRYSDSFKNCPFSRLSKLTFDTQYESLDPTSRYSDKVKHKSKHKHNKQPLSFNRKAIDEEGFRKYYGDLFDDNLKSTNSSRIHEFSKVFDSILNDLVNHKMDLDNPSKSFQQILIDLITQNYNQFSKWRFVKFINIYNHVDDEEFGRIRFYTDFSRNYGIESKDDSYADPLFSIDELFQKNSIYGKAFEYCTSYAKPLFSDENDYFAICKSDTNEIIYSVALGKLLFDGDSRRACHNRKIGFNLWLENIDVCIDKYHITNFYFFNGNIGNLHTKDIDKAIVCSTIGIDYHEENHVLIKTFLNEFKRFIEQVSFRLVYEIKNHQLRRTAIKAAFAQVMARNMSHNISSHVFSNLISNDAYAKLTDRNILKVKSYVSPWDTETKYSKEQAQAIQNQPDNLQLSYFNQYLKSRMDYLSEVTFGIPNMHTTKYIYSDVFKELDRVRIILNYISGVPEFNYTFCLKHNGAVLTDENDIAVAFPNDVLGNQAFYNIIENVIRNTAKHACHSKQGINTFTIEFLDIEDLPEYYCVEIDNGIAETAIGSLVRKQNGRINASVLNNDNNLRNHSLGMLEMKASAAFLRQVDIAKVDSYEYQFDDKAVGFTNKHDNLTLLKAINKNGALGYRFFVKKPQELLFVGNWNVEEKERKKWGNVGVGFIGEDIFVNSMEQGKSFSHSFLIYNEDLTEKTLALLSDENDSKTLLPLRKVKFTQQESEEAIRVIKDSCGNLQALKDCIWKLYMGKMGVVGDDIYIGEVVSRRPDNRQRRQVVFENHSSMEQHEPNWVQKTILPELWIDNLSSQTQSKLPLFGQLSQVDGQMTEESLLTRYIRRIDHQTRLEIFEAYHNKIIAMDERIQRFANENYEGSSKKGGKIPVSALFESTNVIVPAIKLDPDWFDEQTILDLERFIDAEIRGAFLLVHYGILERIYKTESLITQHLEAWARKAQRVVVTSGRGSHSLNLSNSVCFANLSSVLNAFTECRSKYLINCLIYQSRRKNE